MNRTLDLSIWNPVFQRELLTGLRSTRLRLILLLYLLVPFGVIANVWPTDAPYYGGSELASDIWHSYLFAQLGLVILLTPVFAAYTVSSEFQQGTAEFLWTSMISPRAIIRGKMFAVILLCLALLSSSLASLSIVFYLGGVDVAEMLGGFAVLVAVSIAAAAIAVFHSAHFKRGHVALVCTYVTMAALVPVGGCSLRLVIGSISYGVTVFGLPQEQGIALGVIGCLLLVTMLFVRATPALQIVGEKARPNFKPIDNAADLRWRRRNWPYYLVDPMRRLPPLPDAGNAVGHHEPRVHPLHKSEWGYRCAAVMSVLTVPMLILALLQRDDDYRAVVWWVTLVMTGAWTIMLHGVSLTMDQEMSTLEAIRLTCIRPGEFLFGKWLGSIRMRRVLLGIGLVCVTGTSLAARPLELDSWLEPIRWLAVVETLGLIAFAVSSYCSRTMMAVSLSVTAAIAWVWVSYLQPRVFLDEDWLVFFSALFRLNFGSSFEFSLWFLWLGMTALLIILAWIGMRLKWNKER